MGSNVLCLRTLVDIPELLLCHNSFSHWNERTWTPTYQRHVSHHMTTPRRVSAAQQMLSRIVSAHSRDYHSGLDLVCTLGTLVKGKH